MIITASAPTRIDLAGGTLDLEPLYLWHDRVSSVNLAITLPATVRLRPHRSQAITITAHDRRQSVRAASRKKLPAGRLPLITAAVRYFAPASGFTLETDCHAPAGSGLGGSSSLIVALVAAFRKWQKRSSLFPSPLVGEGRGVSNISLSPAWERVRVRGLDKEEIFKIAKGIETSVIKVPTGYQDYLAALYGGLNVWHFDAAGIRHEPLKLSKQFIKTLERQLVLVYTGIPHFSGMNNWEIFKRHVNGNRKVISLFEQLRDNALAMADALKSQNLAQIARVLNRDWATRRKLAPTVSTPKIDRLLRDGKRAGVIGARVCGAGGGGCVALLAKVSKVNILRRWLKNQRIQVLPYRVDQSGLRVEES